MRFRGKTIGRGMTLALAIGLASLHILSLIGTTEAKADAFSVTSGGGAKGQDSNASSGGSVSIGSFTIGKNSLQSKDVTAHGVGGAVE
jgi:hypothetical protein